MSDLAEPTELHVDVLRRECERVLAENTPEAFTRWAIFAIPPIVKELLDERDRLRAAILDIDAHAVPYSYDEDGWTAHYLMGTGALHRALGVVGHGAPKCDGCPHPHTPIEENQITRLKQMAKELADDGGKMADAIRAVLSGPDLSAQDRLILEAVI